jgi:hypothetical protein
MNTTFELNVSELDSSFIEAIKKLFKDKYIRISINATDKITSQKQYSEDTIKAAIDVENNRNIKTFSLQEFEQYSAKLLEQ